MAFLAAIAVIGAAGDPFFVTVGMLTCLSIALASAMNVVMGYGGLLNLGIGAFYGVGAYGAAILTVRYHQGIWIVLIAAVVMAAVPAAVLGPLILRTRGLYFAIATLAIGVIGSDVANNWISMTGGPIGVAGVVRPVVSIGPLHWDLTGLTAMYLACAVVAVIAVAVVAVTGSHRFGRILVAIREDEQLAQSLGYRTLTYKVSGFALSAALAALAGVAYAYAIQYVSPSPFSFLTGSFQAFVIVAVGGGGTVWGPVVAAALLVAVPEFLSFSPTTNQYIYAGALLVVVVALRGGVVPGIEQLTRDVADLRRRHGSTPDDAGSPGIGVAHRLRQRTGTDSTAAPSTEPAGRQA